MSFTRTIILSNCMFNKVKELIYRDSGFSGAVYVVDIKINDEECSRNRQLDLENLPCRRFDWMLQSS